MAGEPGRSGGAERDRTDDLLLAKQALSQLSYSPDGGDTFRLSSPALRGAPTSLIGGPG